MSMRSTCQPEPDFRPRTPFNALPLLPPRVELETKPVMKALVGARAALAELKQAGELIPNQSILINTLPVLEARASSEIENIVRPQIDCSGLRGRRERAGRSRRSPYTVLTRFPFQLAILIETTCCHRRYTTMAHDISGISVRK